MRRALIKFGLLMMSVPMLAMATGAPATDPPPKAAELQAWQSQLAQQLAERGTADTLTAAAVLLPPSTAMHGSKTTRQPLQTASHKKATGRLQLLDRAAVAAPDAADIAALALQVCTCVPGCEVSRHAERLHRAALDDAGYLLPALNAALSQQDSVRVSAILQSMADATTFKTWRPAIRKRLQRGIDGVAVPAVPSGLPAALKQNNPDLDSATFAVSVAAAMMHMAIGRPSYSAIGKACQKESPEFTARQQACRQIGILLSRDPSTVAAQAGLAYWRRAALDKTDLAASTQASRELDWQSESLYRAMSDKTVTPFGSFQAALDNGGDIPGIIALLKEHNLPTTPPEGWVSRREKVSQESPVIKVAAPDSGVCPGTP